MIRVFVSSVYRDLEDCRRQIVDDLRIARYEVINMEAFGARPEVPLEVCLREVRHADVAILVIGPRYGSLIPSGNVSYTHEEFREAKHRDIPVLAFRIPNKPELDATEERYLQDFATEAGQSLTFQTTTPERLSSMILASLTSARDRGELGPRFLLFQPWKKFFAPYLSMACEKQTLFNHLVPFVGRATELTRLLAFAAGDLPLLALVAPGGTGKSRLLLEMAKAIEADGKGQTRVLFADVAAEWSAEDISALPSVPTVLVIDDAHRRADLARFIDACRRQNDQIRFLISFRPGALEIVSPHLSGLLTLNLSDATLTLGPLTRLDATKLTKNCLGAQFAHLAERLVELSNGNPLIVSIGAKCIAAKQVPPEILDHTPEEFRVAVLDRLLLDPSFEGQDGETRRRVLELLAAIAPINSEDSACIEAAAKFLSVQPFELIHSLGELEAVGFIQRRGRLLRVTPDILADHLLYRAAVTINGKATRFVDSVVNSFSPALLSNILANAAELDWRASATSIHDPVLTDTWNTIRRSLPRAPNYERTELVRQLRRAAAFAPEEVLKIIEWLCDNPEAPPDEKLLVFGFKDDPAILNTAICDMLRFIATHPSFTYRCLQRLWPLAESQEGPTHSDPKHPRRVLEDLMEYSEQIPKSVQLIVLRFIVEHLNDNPVRSDMPWAVQMISKGLAKEGESTTATKKSFSIGAFSLAPFLSEIQERRDLAISTLVGLTFGTRLIEASTALNVLGQSLRKPSALFGRQIRPEEVTAWLPEAKLIVLHLKTIASTNPSEIVRYLARRELREASRVQWPELDAALGVALSDTPAVESQKLFDILVGLPWTERHRDFDQEQARLRITCKEAATAFWQHHQTPERVVAALLEALSVLNQATTPDDGSVWELMCALVAERPNSGASIVRELSAKGSENSIRWITAVLIQMNQLGLSQEVLELVNTLGQEGGEELRAGIAGSLRFLLANQTLTVDELKIVEPFLNDESLRVRRASLRVLVNFAKVAPNETVELLLGIDWKNDISMANTVCELFHANYGINPALISDSQIDILLNRIEQLPTLEDDSRTVLDFVAYASNRRIRQTIEMLLRRIDAADHEPNARTGSRRTPIPHGGRGLHLPGLQNAPDYSDFLRRTRDAYLGASSVKALWLSTLYSVLATNSSAWLSVLEEWVQSGNRDRVAYSASLLRGVDHTFVYSHHEFVAKLLEAASKHGTECLGEVSSELYGVANSGLYSGTPGEPMPRHVKAKAEAQKLLALYAARPAVTQFYEALLKHAEKSIDQDLRDFEELPE